MKIVYAILKSLYALVMKLNLFLGIQISLIAAFAAFIKFFLKSVDFFSELSFGLASTLIRMRMPCQLNQSFGYISELDIKSIVQSIQPLKLDSVCLSNN